MYYHSINEIFFELEFSNQISKVINFLKNHEHELINKNTLQTNVFNGFLFLFFIIQ